MSSVIAQIILSAKSVCISVWEPQWPRQCACCNAPDETYIEISIKETNEDGAVLYQRVWEVPYCSQCSQHVARARSLTLETFLPTELSMGSLLAILGGLVCCALFDSTWPFYLSVAVILSLLAFYKWRDVQDGKKIMKDACCCVGPAVICLNHHEYRGHMHTFSLQNKTYAEVFRKLNKSS